MVFHCHVFVCVLLQIQQCSPSVAPGILPFLWWLPLSLYLELHSPGLGNLSRSRIMHVLGECLSVMCYWTFCPSQNGHVTSPVRELCLEPLIQAQGSSVFCFYLSTPHCPALEPASFLKLCQQCSSQGKKRRWGSGWVGCSCVFLAFQCGEFLYRIVTLFSLF